MDDLGTPQHRRVAAKAGHTVESIGHADTDTPVTGEAVVLAVPYPAIAGVIAQRGDQLAGKVVVDITNPLDFQTSTASSSPPTAPPPPRSPPRCPSPTS
jgi:predicted dinucleotide-binding enzyme